MAKVVGFDAAIAADQEKLKRANQRAASLAAKSAHIHSKTTKLLLGERVRVIVDQRMNTGDIFDWVTMLNRVTLGRDRVRLA